MNWPTRNRLVKHTQSNPAEMTTSKWLIQTPQRINGAGVAETLDFWTSHITSSFTYNDAKALGETGKTW